IRSLRDHERLQLAGALLVAVILVSLSAFLWWLRRRYRHSQRSLRQVKMHAHDILASMDRGVVTTDLAGEVTSINSAGMHLLGVDGEGVGLPLVQLSPAWHALPEAVQHATLRHQPLLDPNVIGHYN